MKKLTSLDFKLLFELMKGAKTSDRKIAKALGVSQPTVTRRRKLVEEELVDGYTVVPKWRKLGYEMLAITFVKSKPILGLKSNYKLAHEKGSKWLMEHPNIIMGGGCRGMGMDGFMISVHKSYSDFNRFLFEHKRYLGDQVEDVQTFLVDLGGQELLKPLHLKYLAETTMEETS